MVERELSRSDEMSSDAFPITALCIVADKNKVPKGFTAVTKSHDDQSDADLWRESSFSIWSRPVRYICFSRDVPKTAFKAPVSVITDITVVKESDPIPHGFVAIDYTADTREKALRKRFICVKSEPRDAVLDAVGEVIVLNKNKKTPKDFTQAGEVDGALLCFRVVVIPQSFGLTHSSSEQALSSSSAAVDPRPIGLYPSIAGGAGISAAQSTPALNKSGSMPVNSFTIKGSVVGPSGVDGVPFKLNPALANTLQKNTINDLPTLEDFDISRLDTEEYNYNFALERSVIAQ